MGHPRATSCGPGRERQAVLLQKVVAFHLRVTTSRKLLRLQRLCFAGRRKLFYDGVADAEIFSFREDQQKQNQKRHHLGALQSEPC